MSEDRLNGLVSLISIRHDISLEIVRILDELFSVRHRVNLFNKYFICLHYSLWLEKKMFKLKKNISVERVIFICYFFYIKLRLG